MARTIITATPATGLTGSTITTTTTEGVVESVEDIIELISPWETPFISALEKVGVNDVVHYWQEDELRAAVRNNAKQQGYEPSAAADWSTSTPGMKQNWVQLFTETARVSGTAARVQWYGRGDPMDYEVMKRGREVRRDVEASCLGDQNGVAPVVAAAAGTYPNAPGTGTVARLAGVGRLIDAANQLFGGSGAVSGTAGSAAGLSVTTGTTRAFTETLLLQAQKAAYDQGGNPTTAIMMPYLAQIMANFAYIDPTGGLNATRARILQGAKESTLINVVDIYKSPYGTLAVLIDRYAQGALSGESDEGHVAIVDPDLWALGVLREMQSEPLAKTGDNEKRLLTAEYTLINRATKGAAYIRDLDTTP